ncbi:MAG: hypothetical protein EOM25_08020 [Deltaproteobacteria bacterium]|nr:hypothetical protein [Deltaproteobacteria bacterium]
MKLNMYGQIGLGFLMVFFIACQGFAQGDAVTEMPERGELLTTTLVYKGPGYVSIVDIPWDVDEDAIILDGNGKPMTLAQLPIPCDAEVVLEHRTNDRNMVKAIKVLRVHPGATAVWP